MADLAVAGPMARSVDDLRTSLLAMAGPDRWNSAAWKVDLPPSRHSQLSDFRIGAWIDDDYCPVQGATVTALESLCGQLRSEGAHVDDEARPGFTLEKAYRVFNRLLGAALSGGTPVAELDALAAEQSDSMTAEAGRTTAMRHREWLTENERRLQMRLKWEQFFGEFDAMVMPVQARPAIPHDHSPNMVDRVIDIDGAERSYMDLFHWIAPAGLAYLPATVVPIGFDGDGLPIGVQIVGPYLDDMTTLRLGELISEIMGGCPRPDTAS